MNATQVSADLAQKIETLAGEIQALGNIPQLLGSMAWTAARIAHSAQVEVYPEHKTDLCLLRDYLQALAVLCERAENREASLRTENKGLRDQIMEYVGEQKRLQAELDLANAEDDRCNRELEDLHTSTRKVIADLNADIKKLKASLQPFARYADLNDLHERDPDGAIEVPVRDLLAAKAAMEEPTDA